MAPGDVVSGIASLTTGTSLDYTPASGVEAKITSATFNTAAGPDSLRVQFRTTGTTITDIYKQTETAEPYQRQNNVTIYITNAVYLRLNNGTASTVSAAYSGVQTK